MAQDIRDMFREEKDPSEEKMNRGHQRRFEEKLDREFPENAGSIGYFYWKIAAVLVVALGVGFALFNSQNIPTENQITDSPVTEEQNENELNNQIELGDISPEFEKIENYYLAGINIELSKLEVNQDNKALIDAFMAQFAELDQEYQRLNVELNELGPNEQTIEAMINNLQMRLDMLVKLKNKLNEIKKSKNDNYEDLKA